MYSSCTYCSASVCRVLHCIVWIEINIKLYSFKSQWHCNEVERCSVKKGTFLYRGTGEAVSSVVHPLCILDCKCEMQFVNGLLCSHMWYCCIDVWQPPPRTLCTSLALTVCTFLCLVYVISDSFHRPQLFYKIEALRTRV